MIGKPYSGKPNVRFDEGELEIEHSATTPALYSTERNSKQLFLRKHTLWKQFFIFKKIFAYNT
jgi:hypothetical protein